MPEVKTNHVVPFKFVVGEKVWIPGISDVGRVVERVRQGDNGEFKCNRYLMAYGSDRTGWYEEYDLDSLSADGGLERAMKQAMDRAFTDGVESEMEKNYHTPEEIDENGGFTSVDQYFIALVELAELKARVKKYKKWRAQQ